MELEQWMEKAKEIGFSEAGALKTATLEVREDVRDSMEGYGLFVTQVCRDNGLKYYYGPRTIAYTACVLF